jgi:4-aminobutyrate aminotransferase-like enzyme
MTLIAEDLVEDPVFLKAKQEILALMENYRERISEIRPPHPNLTISYEEAIQTLSQYRGQSLFYPYLGSGFGNGALVELADGSIKLDFISGIGTHWGHCNAQLISAAIDASIQDICIQGNLQQNKDSLELMELLIKHSGLDHCILTTSGAMANENALKIIFQKKAPASRVLAFEKCFMGRTLSLAQITDKPAFREGLPPTLQVDYIPFFDWRKPKESTANSIKILQSHLQNHPQEYACMCFELIQGEAGCYPGEREFFVALLKLLKQEGIAVLCDEIQTFGRTDRLFAFQHFELEEYVDVVTCGKLMHSCATLFRRAFCPKPGLIAQTFTSSTSCIRVSKEIVKSLLDHGYLGVNGKNLTIRNYFLKHLQRLEKDYSAKFQGPFGYGLMIACTPFGGEKEKVVAFAKALFEEGLIVFTGGTDPMRIRFLVPIGSITNKDIDQAALILETTLRKM